MELFRQMWTNALVINDVMAYYGIHNSTTQRGMRDLQYGIKVLQGDSADSSIDTAKTMIRRGARIMTTKSVGIPLELDRMGYKIGGNNAQTRQLRTHSVQLQKARNGLIDLEREIDNAPSRPLVIFDNQTISTGHRLDPIALKHPGGPVKRSKPPCAELKISGLVETRVTVDIEHVQGLAYGGHIHSVGRGQDQVGTFTVQPGATASSTPGKSPALEFKLPRSSQPFHVTYQATDFCSRFKVTIYLEGYGDRSFFLDVKFGKTMEDLSAVGHKYIKTYTNDDAHPDSHWGRPPLVAAVKNVADAYGREIEAGRFGEVTGNQRLLRVNDLSLPWGGLFLCHPDVEGYHGHGNHRWGQNVDISYNDMNELQRKWFGKTGSQYFSTAKLHKKDTESVHWHCSVHM